MRIGTPFTPMDPNESEVLGFDFSPELAAGETILTAQWTLSTISGTDANPASHLSGAALIDGYRTTQRVTGLAAGATYRVLARVTTSAGNTLSLWSSIAANSP